MKNKINQLFYIIRNCFEISYKSSKKYFFIRVILEILMTFVPFMILVTNKNVINAIVALPNEVNDHINNFLLLAALLLCLEIISIIMRKIQEYCGGVHKDLIGRKINEKIAKQAVSLDLAYFDSTKYYNEITNTKRDSFALESFTWLIIDLLRAVVQFLISVIVLIKLNWIFTFIIVISAIPSLIIEKKFTRRIYNWQRKRVPEERKMGYIMNILTGRNYAKDIRLFGIQEDLLRKHKELWNKWFSEKRHLTFKKIKWVTILTIVPKIASVSILIFVGIRIINGILTIGHYALYMGIVAQLMNGISSLITHISSLYDNHIRIENYNKFIQWESNIVNNGTRIPDYLSIIEFDNVTFKYPDIDSYVLKNVSFKIDIKEKIALVGVNGAGKSTIVKLLLRYYDPTEGTIYLNGIDLREYDINALRRCYSVMFQDFSNYAFSIRENVTLSDISNKDDDIKLSRACEKSDLNTLINKFESGLDTFLTRQFEEDGKELSGGEWQKIAIARTFFRDGSIIILDEPSSSLDAEAEHRIFEKFMLLCEGKGAIIISHRLSNVTMADRIIVIENGTVIEDGSHEYLMKQDGRYAYLFNLQADKYKEKAKI